MADQTILERFDDLNTWTSGTREAVHQPLLILYALGRWSQGDHGDILYEDVSKKVGKLLKEFGPSAKTRHPEYPFFHMRRDVWAFHAPPSLGYGKTGEPLITDMKALNVRAGFTDEVKDAFRNNPKLVTEIASRVLERYFPESLHEDILDEVGLSLDTKSSETPKRDPGFRDRVLIAYGYQCAVCGFDLKLGTISIAIEAAHIKWHQACGPDVECNGLALCSTHHKLFDYGAFTVRRDGTILVSELVNGVVALEQVLKCFHGKPIRSAVNPAYVPATEHLDWHRKQVFKEPPRHLEAAGG
jgi:putative restriction endonuclease